jgi:hypothetical protein
MIGEQAAISQIGVLNWINCKSIIILKEVVIVTIISLILILYNHIIQYHVTSYYVSHHISAPQVARKS